MAEFTIGDKQYRSSKMNAFDQFHVARKVAPLITKMGERQGLVADSGLPEMLAPLVDALAAMPEEDCNYVLYHCLAVVQRYQGGTLWAPVWSVSAKRLMFEDIDLGAMIQITIQVLSDNLGNFLNTPGSALGGQASPESSTPGNLSPFPMAKIG
jgi:hypothetical protein